MDEQQRREEDRAREVCRMKNRSLRGQNICEKRDERLTNPKVLVDGYEGAPLLAKLLSTKSRPPPLLNVFDDRLSSYRTLAITHSFTPSLGHLLVWPERLVHSITFNTFRLHEVQADDRGEQEKRYTKPKSGCECYQVDFNDTKVLRNRWPLMMNRTDGRRRRYRFSKT